MQFRPTLLNKVILMVQQSESFRINSQGNKGLKIHEAEPLQFFLQPFSICRLETIVLSNQKPLVFSLMLEDNVSTMNVDHNPSPTLILNEAKIETFHSIIHNLAELSISILKVETS
jgi:hypothetical protein